ncbi:DUF2057 family protein [Shewanella waksmanii]|uniref:YccT family protein n=1 Tax=Shewanella waksmanii TaxID=213783 RepID=UPI003734CCBA
MIKISPLFTHALTSVTCFASVLYSANTLASVEVSFPTDTQVLVANGKANTATTLTLDNGTQQILFKHVDSYRDFGDKKRFISEAVILTFEANDNSYQVSLPNINSNRGADNFNRSPRVTLTDSAGDNVKFKVDILKKDGLQLGRNYVEELNLYNGYAPQPKAPASPPKAAIAAVPAVAPESTPAASSNVANTSVMAVSEAPAINNEQINVGQMLDFWYSQADEKTREAFKQRIKDK